MKPARSSPPSFEATSATEGQAAHGAPSEPVRIPTLKKHTLGGQPYTRRPEITAKLEELLGLPPAERVARCGISQPADPGFVHSECVMYLVRAARAESASPDFERLYGILLTRVRQRLPRSDMREGVRLKEETVREQVLDTLTERLATDRKAYDERLDYFEICFDSALSRLRHSASKSEGRRAKRFTSLGLGEDGELSPEVKDALLAAHENGVPDFFLTERYRSAFEAAIDTLPPDERTVMHMLIQGLPIDSKDPDQITISDTLGKAEKTVRNVRDRALVKLRAALVTGGGE
jgi:hypothetical protein